MLSGIGGTAQIVVLTLYTDAFVIRGSIETRQRRVTDILNASDEPFLVLSDVTTVEFGPTGETVRADFAQVNLASTLFAVADTAVEPVPELRMMKAPQQALISIPPFKVLGDIHLMPTRALREALGELVGRFLPVTDATFWSDALGEPAHLRGDRRREPRPRPDPGTAPRRGPVGGHAGRRLEAPAAASRRRPGLVGPRRPAPPQRSTGRSSRLPHSAQPPS